MKIFIKTISLACFWLLVSVCPGAARTQYISETFEVPMRSGQSLEHRIIALIPSGRAVALVTPGEDWSLVRLPNGREGWVPTRYLTDDMPSAMQLERLESKHAEAMAENQALQAKSSELTSENRRLSDTLRTARADLEQLETAHEALKHESAAFLELKAGYEQSQQELAELRQKADQCETSLNRLASDQLYQGMLYGGGLVVVGLIAGLILKKPKRRPSLM